MAGSGIPRDIDDVKVQYPHITKEMAASFLEAEATPEQWKAADTKAKLNIYLQLENYKYVQKVEVMTGIKVMVIGETQSGKSATANTLIGHKWFEEGASTDSVISEACAKIYPIDNTMLKTDLIVCDIPGSWESQTGSPGLDGVDCYLIVISLASPCFSQETFTKLMSLKGIDGSFIVESGQFVVVLSHAESALHHISLKQYLEGICGDPLHTFLTQVAEGRVVAINNAAETDYQRELHQKDLFSLLVKLYNQPMKEVKASWKAKLSKVASSAKRIGDMPLGQALGKVRAKLPSTSESSGETIQPSTHGGQTEGKGERPLATSDTSSTTVHPPTQHGETQGNDEEEWHLQQEQQQQQLPEQQQQQPDQQQQQQPGQQQQQQPEQQQQQQPGQQQQQQTGQQQQQRPRQQQQQQPGQQQQQQPGQQQQQYPGQQQQQQPGQQQQQQPGQQQQQQPGQQQQQQPGQQQQQQPGQQQQQQPGQQQQQQSGQQQQQQPGQQQQQQSEDAHKTLTVVSGTEQLYVSTGSEEIQRPTAEENATLDEEGESEEQVSAKQPIQEE